MCKEPPDSKISCGAKQIVIIGNFPPPMGGAAKNTEIIYEYLSCVADVEAINTSPKLIGHSKNITRYLHKIYLAVKSLAHMTRLLRKNRLLGKSATVYLVLDGGKGVLFSFLYFLVSKNSANRIVLQHRTYLYIQTRGMMFRFVMNRLWNANHVFLSEGMQRAFVKKYAKPRQSSIVQNSVFVPFVLTELGEETETLTIGFIGNLCKEKGFNIFCSLATRFESQGGVEFHIAGKPVGFRDRKLLEDITLRDNVKYKGEISGERKIEFYLDVDVLVFPTLFPQEAQPNTLFEAMAMGVGTISTPAGVIPEMLYNIGTIVDTVGFVDACEKELHMWRDSQFRVRRKVNALREFKRISQNSVGQFDDFVAEMLR